MGRTAEPCTGKDPYAPTSYNYNARDQLISSNQTGQVRSFSYDGYGRLSAKYTPEQGTTSYSYFANDTVQTMTDARGASTTFAYNNRDLVTNINYVVPAGVAATSNVVFGYDEAGNRTSMSDGLGSVSYAYNALSQMTSETRNFNSLGSSYTLGYGYNLAGELTSLTNPFGVVVSYNYDAVGRPISVSGSNYAGVTSYVNNIAYRAFGMKQMNYANGRTLSLGYDNRMRLSSWDSGNLTNDGSQSYSYDATGQQSYASGGGGGGAPAFTNDPLVAGVTEVKAVHITELRTAINQVRAGVGLAAYSWTYSVTTNDWITAGPILEMRTALDQAMGAPSGGYAAGLAQDQPILAIHIQELRDRIKTALGSSALTQYYDGDRLRGKKSEYGATTYYVRSSVLGGQVIAELGASGNWAKGYVYLGGQMLAIQNGAVNWVHQDPVTKSQRVTNSSGAVISTIDLDPWGGETNRSANSAFQPHKYTTYERDGNGGDDAMHRRYQSSWTRFSQPDPYDGSYSLRDPQSFNRYGYVQNDPVNFVDPSGLDASFCGAEYSYADCGGDAGFWSGSGGRGAGGGGGGGGFGGSVAEYNREYGGMPASAANALHLHNQRVNNAIGGYGFITNEELRRIEANAFIRDPLTGQLVPAGGDMWIEDNDPFGFFGGGLDSWPPPWPRSVDGFDRTFGWRTQPPPELEQFPKKIVSGPEGPQVRREFDPHRVPSNASRSSRFARAGIRVIEVLGRFMGAAGVVIDIVGPVATPALKNMQCQQRPQDCFSGTASAP